MTYVGAEYSEEELFRQLKKQVKEENVKEFDQYSELVDSILEEKKSYGFFVDEEDLEQLRSILEQKWMEVRVA